MDELYSTFFVEVKSLAWPETQGRAHRFTQMFHPYESYNRQPSDQHPEAIQAIQALQTQVFQLFQLTTSTLVKLHCEVTRESEATQKIFVLVKMQEGLLVTSLEAQLLAHRRAR